MPVRALPPLPTQPPASGASSQPAGAEPGAFQAALANSGGGEPAPPAATAADRRDPAIAATGVDVAVNPGIAELCLPAGEAIAAPKPVVAEAEQITGQVSETPDTPPAENAAPPPAAARPPVTAPPVQAPPLVATLVAEAEPLVAQAPDAPPLPKRKAAAGDAPSADAPAPGDRPVDPAAAPAPIAVAAAPVLPVADKTGAPPAEGTAPTEVRTVGHATSHAVAEPAAPAPAPAPEARVPAPLFSQTLEAAAPRVPAQPYDAMPAAAANATVTVREGRFGADIGVAIARARENADEGGGDALLIRLDPRHMGRIDVRMTFDDDGTIRAVMRADSPAALDLLRRESVHLDRALADAGIRADAQSLRFESGGGSGQRESARHPGFTPSGPAADFQPVPDGAQPDLRSLRGSGQLDVLA